jgi:16S rRNA (guanine966-N2)-methyltransferase
VLERKGLRPTPDRVRETLFNWLVSDIAGARVLDCFAGAGGLGLEAASREANSVTMVEIDKHSASHLEAQCQRLNIDNVTVNAEDIHRFLERTDSRFDVVFIDPPYDFPALRSETLDLLVQNELLNNDCKVYLEWPVEQDMELRQPGFSWVRQKTAGQVVYAIAQWQDTR